MRVARILAVVFMSALVPQVAKAQVPIELREAFRARDLARAQGDVTVWDRHTADDFTVVQADGTFVARGARLMQVSSGQVSTLVTRPQDEHVARYGDIFVRRFFDGEVWRLEVWATDTGVWKASIVQSTSSHRTYTIIRVF